MAKKFAYLAAILPTLLIVSDSIADPAQDHNSTRSNRSTMTGPVGDGDSSALDEAIAAPAQDHNSTRSNQATIVDANDTIDNAPEEKERGMTSSGEGRGIEKSDIKRGMAVD